ncbi:ino80 complex subunit d [Phtheirospermum japonicum]|uniref:KAT8 regulatory NSL complex subunit 2 n=1 Tax=Phtheirospermum japonicum TaxID=374723 RepID=A0A830BQU2_9LAMI|nr:ino80 complex subunit d [Phtheirospermum japonicum]
MPTATPTTAAAGGKSHHSTAPLSIKPETKPSSVQSVEMLDPSSSSPSGPIRIDGFERDAALSRSEFLTRSEILNRRARRVKQLSRIYRDHYWALMEELKLKFREYYWEYGKSPFVEDEEGEKINSNRGDYAAVPAENVGNGNLGVNGPSVGGKVSGRCEVHGCKAKAMALTRFCHMHIMSDGKQKLYMGCTFSIKSSTTGPILCGRPLLKSTVPTYCSMHFQKAEKHMVRALKKVGLNVSSTNKLAPKFHVIVAEYVRQIQNKRRAAKRVNLENAVIKEENNS